MMPSMADMVDMEVMAATEDMEAEVATVDMVDVEGMGDAAPLVAVGLIIMEEVAEGAAPTWARRWMLKLKPILTTKILAFLHAYV